MVPNMKIFEFVTEFCEFIDLRLHRHRVGFFFAHITDPVEPGLNLSSSNGKVHGAIFWMNDRIRDGQGTAGNEGFVFAGVGTAIGF